LTTVFPNPFLGWTNFEGDIYYQKQTTYKGPQKCLAADAAQSELQ
jgi:hypothetical protein